MDVGQIGMTLAVTRTWMDRRVASGGEVLGLRSDELVVQVSLPWRANYIKTGLRVQIY